MNFGLTKWLADIGLPEAFLKDLAIAERLAAQDPLNAG